MGVLFSLIWFLNRPPSKEEKKSTVFYEKLSNVLGLRMNSWDEFDATQTFPKLLGSYKGRKIEVDAERRTLKTGIEISGGRIKLEDDDIEVDLDYTKISMEVKNEGYYLSLRKEFLILKLGKKLFKIEDIQINDPLFDKHFIIKSNDEKFAKDFLNEPIKNVLMDFHPKLSGEIVIEPNKVYFDQPYIIDSLESYHLTLEAIELLAIISNRVENMN
jgi:hypothetical protein